MLSYDLNVLDYGEKLVYTRNIQEIYLLRFLKIGEYVHHLQEYMIIYVIEWG